MQVTARHFSSSPALTEAAEKAAQSFTQYHDNIISTDIVLEKSESGDSVEFVVHVGGKTVVSKESEGDFYKAMHNASDNIVRQLQKLKDKSA